MLILSDADISDLLPLEQIIQTIEDAIVAYEKQEAIVPQRMHISNGNNMLLCMPSFSKHFFGTKLVSVVPSNSNLKLPVTNGAMLLNDAVTGLPLALINAAKLTALRTGAVGAIGVKSIAPADETSFGLIGCGVQGLHQALMICVSKNIRTIYFHQRSSATEDVLVAFLHKHHPHVQAIACSSPSELLRKTNIIVAATTSAQPVLPNDAALLQGKHFISIGSYKSSMQELPDAVYQLAGTLVIDSEFARSETGDTLNPVKNGLIKAEDVFTIGKLFNKERSLNVHSATVFKSSGMALFDLFLAQAMYKAAVKQNKGTNVFL